MLPVEPRLVQVERRPREATVAGPRLPDVRCLVVAREDKLGDFVLALPAVALLRATYPETDLVLLVHERVVPLARLVPGVSRVLAAGRSTLAVARALREIEADVLVAISRRPSALIAARLAGVRRVVGAGRRWWSPLAGYRVDERRRGVPRHEVEFSLSFAHRIGAAPDEPRFPLTLPADAREEVRRWLDERAIVEPFIVLHPGSGGSCPRWPSPHFAELARLLRERGRPVIVSVGPEDGEVAPDFARDPAVFSGGLPALAALLAEAALVVGNSTGPLHLAAALGTPTLSLHVAWPSCGAVRWGPYSARGWALVVGNPDLLRLSRRRRDDHGAAALAALAPEVVLAHARSILERQVG